jgi:hypothetical protein
MLGIMYINTLKPFGTKIMIIKFTDDQLKELKDKGYSNRAVARELGVNESSVRVRLKKLAESGYSPDHNWHNDVPDGYRVKGVSQYVDQDGTVIRQWVKSERASALSSSDYIELLNELPSYPLFRAKKDTNYQDTASVYPLGDPHIGMLAWAKECGEDWDLEIAEEMFRKTFDVVVSKSPPSTLAVLSILGDTLHYDNLYGMTTRSGHVLDTDGRYPKMVAVCVRIVLNMINSLLQRHKTVTVDIVQGNHDDVGSIWLRELLLVVYNNNPRVTIVNQHSPIHIIEFGKVLLASHHGHTMKMDQLPITIASDYAEEWGRTKHRYCLTGHIHHDSKVKKVGQEYTGMYVESFRTLAAKDSYATWGGWRSKRDTKCIVYHRELGEIERYTASVDSLLLQTES